MYLYDPGRVWKTDEFGKSIPVGPEIIHAGAKAMEKFADDLREGAEILSHEIIDGEFFQIYGAGNEPFFEFRFQADRIMVEWDAYKRPAWYELIKQYKQNIMMSTPNGKVTIEAHVIKYYDSDELFAADSADEVDSKSLSIGITYEGKDYCGRGKDRDAWHDLQRQLPDGVKILE